MSNTIVSSGVTSHSLVLENGQQALVYGSAVGTDILSGGSEYIMSGGAASAVAVFNGGAEVTSPGGRDAATLIFSGGIEYDTGSVLSATVYSAGTLYVSGGTASLTILSSGGGEYLLSGGTAYGTMVENGGVQSAFSGGTASGSVVSRGGIAEIGSAGSGAGISVLSGGAVYISGTASATTVSNGGQAILFAGGIASGSVIDAGGAEITSSGGTTYSATIMSGGAEIVQSGGNAVDAMVDDYGALVVLPGGTATGTQLGTGGMLISTGIVLVNPHEAVMLSSAAAMGDIVQAGGTQYILGGGIASATQLDGNGAAFAVADVYAGGEASNTIIGSAGQEYVFSGGKAADVTVNSGGYFYVSNGIADATRLNAGATMDDEGVSANAISTTLSGGSRQFAGSGATVILTTVDAGAVQLVSGGTAFETQVNSGGTQYVDADSIAIDTDVQGREVVSANATANGATIDGGMLVLSGGGVFVGSMMFAGSGGTLAVDNPNIPAAPIGGFISGDAIDLNTLVYNASYEITVPSPGILQIAGETISVTNAANAADFRFIDNNGETEITTDMVPCFAAGTRILTPHGAVNVEMLAIGDRVITHTGDDAPIIWIGHRHIDLRGHPNPAAVQPIRIAANSLAYGEPSRDLLLSPDHAIYLGGVLVPAKALVDAANIVQLNYDAVSYFHIELETHAIVFAEDLAVETYLDTGNRAAFQNGAEIVSRIAVQPQHLAQTRRERDSYAPFAKTTQAIAAARQMVASRR